MSFPRCGSPAFASSLVRQAALALLVVGIVLPQGVWAQPQPLGWLPEDVGLVLVLDQPAPRIRHFLKGPLGERLLALPALQRWWKKNGPGLMRTYQQVESRLGLAPGRLEEVALSRQGIVALWPPSPGKEDGHVLVLVSCSGALQAQELAAGLRRLIHGDPARWTLRQVGNRSYWLHQAQDSKHVAALATVGPVLILANDEEKLRGVLWATGAGVGGGKLPAGLAALGFRNAPAQRPRLVQSAQFRQAWARRVPGTLAWAFFTLPVWEPAVRRDAEKSQDKAAQQVLRLWPALRYAVLGLHAEQRLLLYGWIALEESKLPPEVRHQLAALSGPSDVLGHFPAEAIAAASVHVDLHAVFRAHLRQQHEVPVPVQGVVLGLLKVLEPRQGAVLLPYEDAQNRLRLGWALALAHRVRWDPAGAQQDEVKRALEEVLPGLAGVLGSGIADRPLQYRPQQLDQDFVLYVPETKQGDKGSQEDEEHPGPVFALGGGMLWMASSGEVLKRIARLDPEHSVARSPAWDALAAVCGSLGHRGAVPGQVGLIDRPHHWFYISFRQLRTVLQRRPMAWPELFEPQRKYSPDQVRKASGQLLPFLQLADYAVGVAEVTSEEIRFALALGTE